MRPQKNISPGKSNESGPKINGDAVAAAEPCFDCDRQTLNKLRVGS